MSVSPRKLVNLLLPADSAFDLGSQAVLPEEGSGQDTGGNNGNQTPPPQGGTNDTGGNNADQTPPHEDTNDVPDDTPVAVQGASVSIRVDEDFGHWDWNWGWSHFHFGHFDDTRFTDAQLQDLVDAGTDGPAVFALDTSISGPVKTTDGALVTSHGVQVNFAAVSHRIIGFADTDGDGSRDPGERVVFRLADKGDRGFDFDLRGEVDHPAGNNDSGAEILRLDLTDAFSVTDSDGDPVTLAANSIVAELQETNRDDDTGSDAHGPDVHWPHGHWPDWHGRDADEPGQDEGGSDAHGRDADGTPGQHGGAWDVQGPDANEPGQDEGSDAHGPDANGTNEPGQHGGAWDAQGPDADEPGQLRAGAANDMLADLIGQDAFHFNADFEGPVTHLLAAAGELFDRLDDLAVNVPALQAALTELEGRFEMIANALQEPSQRDAATTPHQDNFVL